MTRRQRLWLPAMVLVMAVVAAACGSDDEPTVSGGGGQPTAPTFPAGSTMANIQSKGKLVVGTKFDQPGLGVKNPTNNKLTGFDTDIARLIAVAIFGGTVDDIDSKIEWKEAPTPQRQLLIQNGTVDLIVATYTINDERKTQIDFAGPYFIAGQDIMVKATDTSIKTVTDLNGKKVCSVLDSTPAKRVREKAPQADLIEFASYALCKDELLNGRVAAVSTDNIILLGFVDANPTLKLVGNRFSDEPYGIGLEKGDSAFRDFVNNRLEQIYQNGEWAKAFDANLKKYGLATPTPPPVDRYQSTGEVVPAPTVTTAAGGATTTTVAATTSTTR